MVSYSALREIICELLVAEYMGHADIIDEGCSAYVRKQVENRSESKQNLGST